MFDLTKPCPHCPFRTDCRKGWLGEERATEIADDLLADKSFSCHETTSFDDDCKHTPTDREKHCAGAAILLEKLDRPNQMMRISERLGLYDRRKLDMDAPVFDDECEFIDHHTVGG